MPRSPEVCGLGSLCLIQGLWDFLLLLLALFSEITKITKNLFKLRLRPPQIDQILPFFPNSEKRDFLRKKYRGLGVWSNLEIDELVR